LVPHPPTNDIMEMVFLQAFTCTNC